MTELIKKLRDALGWSQTALAQALKLSYGSIQGYEAGRRVPSEVVEKLKALALGHGLTDIAAEFMHVRPEIPGDSEKNLIDFSARAGKNKIPPNEQKTAHRLLDEIYRSGNPDAVDAVFRNLVVFARYVRLHEGPPTSKKRR